MSRLPPDWKCDRLKDVSAINAASLPADTDLDYEFDYLEISNVDYHGIVDPNDCASKTHPRGRGGA
jgi:type I restriction enzyme, S subunit